MARPGPLRSQSLSTTVLICLLGMLWAAGIFSAKISMNHGFPPLMFAGTEAIGIAGVSTVIAVISGSRFKVTRAYLVYWCVTGTTMVVIPYLFTYVALDHVGVSRAAVLQSLTSVFTALIAVSLRMERVGLQRAAGIVLSLCGVNALAFFGGVSSVHTSPGAGWLLVGLLAPLSYAVSNTFAYKVSPSGLDVPGKARGSNVVAACLLATVIVIKYAWAPTGQGPHISTTAIVVAGVAVSFNAVASLLFFHLASSRGALNASAAGYAMTASGVVLGVAFLHEPVSWALAAALATTMAGVFLVTRRSAGRVNETADAEGETGAPEKERETVV